MHTHQTILASVGFIVIGSQSAESLLKVLVTYVIQDGKPLTYDRIMKLDAAHRKRTLGFFIGEMQKRASFDPSIGDTLERFLESRNKLVHHFSDIPGHDLSTEADLAAVGAFLDQLARDLQTVLVFCAALLHAWSEQTGIAKGTIETHFPEDLQVVLEKIKTMSSEMNALIFGREK